MSNDWAITYHAAERMAERRVDTADVLAAVQLGRREAADKGLIAYSHNGLQVVVNDVDRVVVTVFKRHEMAPHATRSSAAAKRAASRSRPKKRKRPRRR